MLTEKLVTVLYNGVGMTAGRISAHSMIFELELAYIYTYLKAYKIYLN